jgi:hypothetical protein
MGKVFWLLHKKDGQIQRGVESTAYSCSPQREEIYWMMLHRWKTAGSRKQTKNKRRFLSYPDGKPGAGAAGIAATGDVLTG